MAGIAASHTGALTPASSPWTFVGTVTWDAAIDAAVLPDNEPVVLRLAFTTLGLTGATIAFTTTGSGRAATLPASGAFTAGTDYTIASHGTRSVTYTITGMGPVGSGALAMRARSELFDLLGFIGSPDSVNLPVSGRVDIAGAMGGNAAPGSGHRGRGGRVTGTIGSGSYTVTVGGMGGDGTGAAGVVGAGGYNGGAPGGTSPRNGRNGGGGGGRTEISGVAIAPGGGGRPAGSGTTIGGDGGTTTGESGGFGASGVAIGLGGSGGSPSAGGTGGANGGSSATSGGTGTPGDGGVGGNGSPGNFGQGGGGGGGGKYGGGGGGGSGSSATAGGGGGGSDDSSGLGSPASTRGANSAHGYAFFAWGFVDLFAGDAIRYPSLGFGLTLGPRGPGLHLA